MFQIDKLFFEHSKTPCLTWDGKFQDISLEKSFRTETWPQFFNFMGWMCFVSAVFYNLAGIGPLVEFGFQWKILFLTIARVPILIIASFILWKSRNIKNKNTIQYLIVLFLSGIGLYESMEAVLLYSPDLEFSTPFTLLIIFLMYFLVPLELKPICITASFSSITYVMSLIIFSVPSWENCIQLSIFFIFSNTLGTYFFIKNAKSRRLQFYAFGRIKELNQNLKIEIAEKEKANRTIAKLATTDELTCVPNRRKFMQVVKNEFERGKRYAHPLSFLIVDVDFFKQVNDTYGHQVGDTVLKTIASTIFNSLRDLDFMGRIGGEEFGIILTETNSTDAFMVSERIRRSIEILNFNSISPSLKTTVSIGIATANKYSKEIDDYFKNADDALYKAKQKGRNRSLKMVSDQNYK